MPPLEEACPSAPRVRDACLQNAPHWGSRWPEFPVRRQESVSPWDGAEPSLPRQSRGELRRRRRGWGQWTAAQSSHVAPTQLLLRVTSYGITEQ